jgi:hypothetical protein
MSSEQYIPIPGQLSVVFESDTLDMLQVGVLGTHLHEILNQVAITVLQVHDELERDAGRAPSLRFIPQTYERQDTLVRGRLKALRQGSIEMDIAAVVAAVFSQPGAVAILTNLLSNAIWAIGVYGARVSGVYVDWKKGREDEWAGFLMRPEAGRRRLRPRIEKFIEMLYQSSGGGKLKLKTRDVEIEIEFYGVSRPNVKRVEDA